MDRPLTRRPGRLVRTVALAVGGLVVLVVGGIAVLVATFDPNSRKPQIIAAVQAATGRELTIGGRIGLSFSLQPTLEISDVSLGNPPGFSRPQMVTVQKLELRVALVPLLAREIRVEQLVLRNPDILLETNANGQSNWDVIAGGPSGIVPGAPRLSSPPPPAQPTPGPSAAPSGAPSGGPSSAPSGTPSSAPSGTPSSPPSLAGNSAASPPPGLVLASVTIEGGTVAVRDSAGHTATLVLTELSAREGAPDAPVSLTLDATYNGVPVSLIANTGPLAALLAGGGAPWPVRLAVSAAGARFDVDGTVAQPAAGRGLAIALTADIPDLAALSPLTGIRLPPLKSIAARFKLRDAEGGNGIAISDLQLTLPNADLAGSVSVLRGARPVVEANLSARRIDLDAITHAVAAAIPTPAVTGAPAGAPTASGKSVAPAASDTHTARSGRVIPDTRLPFDALRLADSDIRLAINDLRTGGQDYKAITLHAVTKDARLTLDPVTLDAPGGLVDLKATVDANPAAPPVSLTLRAPNLALQPLLTALGNPGNASGTLELRADLRGAGDTPHAIAASLDGAVGIAVAKGEIDSRVLGSLMASLVRKTDLSRLVDKAGMSTLNCFAARLDATGGMGTLKALRLDSSTLGMTGGGTLNFDTEALDLRLRPSAGLAGATITAPLVVGGTFADRTVRADMAGTGTGDADSAGKPALGVGTGGVALIIGSASGQKASGNACAEPLALARFGQPPPAGAASDADAPLANQPPAKAAKDPLRALKKLFQ